MLGVCSRREFRFKFKFRNVGRAAIETVITLSVHLLAENTPNSLMNDKHNDVVTIGVALLVIIALVIDEVDKIHFSKEFSINI